MPNIFKSFLKPVVNSYVFPDAEELQMEASPPAEEPEPEEASPPEEEAREESGAARIDYARIQAEEILADARRQAERLLEEAREQGRREVEEAREEAKGDGYRQGYAEGLTQARIEEQAKLEETVQQQGRQIQAFLEQATQAREDLLQQAREELCDLSIAVAEKVIHVSLKSSREVIGRMIQVATEKLKRREWVHIYVGGCDAKSLAQLTPELVTALAGLSDHVKLIPMADDESGTCIIEMPDEIIDASVSTQMNNIRELLRES